MQERSQSNTIQPSMVGCATLKELRTKAKFVRVTSAGFRESHVHDVSITKEAPNYRLE